MLLYSTGILYIATCAWTWSSLMCPEQLKAVSHQSKGSQKSRHYHIFYRPESEYVYNLQ